MARLRPNPLAKLARSRRASTAGFAGLALLLVVALGFLAAMGGAGRDTPAAATALGARADTDGDGLPDLDETSRWGTDPASADTDRDGLPDAWEASHAREDDASGRLCPDPLVPDADRACADKRHALRQDFALGTDPHLVDSDGDGIPDDYESTHGMDPLVADAQADRYGDGLTNLQRYQLGARADTADTACSGMTDAEKARHGLDVRRASTGGSGVPDGWALHWGLDPKDPSIGGLRLDGDPDGLTVREKADQSFRALDLCATDGATPPFSRGLDPRDPDSDDDGLPDAWEIRHGLDPMNALDAGPVRPDVATRVGLATGDPRVAPRDPSPRESAAGALSNLEAFLLGACPDVEDCDGDGLTTREEAVIGWSVDVEGETRVVFSDPLRRATDGDRIPDRAKRDGTWTVDGRTYRFAPLDPLTPDTDGDGLPDADELLRFQGLLDPTRRDTDGDAFPDGEEAAYWDARAAADPARAGELCATCSVLGGDAPPNVANRDSDGDGLSDGDEVRPRVHPVAPGSGERAPFPATDPASADTDGDGLPDAWEKANAHRLVELGLWDLDPSKRDSLAGLGRACLAAADDACHDGTRDLDDDGLSNALELAVGVDPHLGDTDGDGLPDGWEHEHSAEAGARFAATDLAGVGWRWLPRAGDPVRLSPNDPLDADAPLAEHTLARFDGGARVDETTRWTFRDAFTLGVSPLQPDADRDGLPDLWEILLSRSAPEGAPPLSPSDAADGARDDDNDGLTTREEFALGTSPWLADTDGGGLGDRLEVELRLDPLQAGDDAADGDLDGDGLSNADELQVWRTRVDHPDTDGDGLLDGPDVTLPAGDRATDAEAALRERFLDAGIIHRVIGAPGEPALVFLGEHGITRDAGLGCALQWSCAGDGLPDSWKRYYALRGDAFYPPTQSLTEDGLGVMTEYAWGRPAGWDEATDGTWWLGLDPTRADTNGDGVRDDTHTRLAERADLDRDGLHDLDGSDPFPYYDRANAGALDVHDRRALVAALHAREAARGARSAAPVFEPAQLLLDTPAPARFEKNGTFDVQGRLVLAGGGPAPAGVPVLVQLVPSAASANAAAARSGDASATLGAGFTDAQGTFRVQVALERGHTLAVPTNTTLFGTAGAAAGTLTWEVDTSRYALGASYRVLVWTYDAVRDDTRVAGTAAWLDGATRVASDARLLAQAAPARPGDTARLHVTLADAAGDPHTPARSGLLAARVNGLDLAPASTEGPNATFQVPVPADAAPEPLAVTLRFAGDGILGAGETLVNVTPRFPTTLTARPVAGHVATGGDLTLEGRLVDARGMPVAGAAIDARLGSAVANATTRDDGSYRLTLRVSPTSGLGARVPQVNYAGGPHHEPAAANATAVLVRAEPALTNVTASLALDRGGEIRGRLLAAGVAPVDPMTGAPPRIRATIGAATLEATPDAATGAFRFLVPPSATRAAGIVPVQLESAGNDLVLAAGARVEAAVAVATKLELDSARLVRGEAQPVGGRLVEESGSPVAGATVVVALANATPSTAITGKDGRFTARVAAPAGERVGPLVLTARYDGEPPARAPSAASAEALLLSAIRVHLETPVLDTSNATAVARFADDEGAPLGGLLVEWRLRGADARQQLTEADGRIRLPLPAGTLAGNVTHIHLHVAPEGTRAALSHEIDVLLVHATTLRLDVQTEDLVPGTRGTASATLHDAAGRPLSGHRVAFVLGALPLGSATTDGSGRAALTFLLPSDAPLGATSLLARHEATVQHGASTDERVVRVRSEPTLTWDTSVQDAETLSLRVRVLDPHGGAVQGATVMLDVPGYAASVRLVTNDSGVAHVEGLPARADGEVRARFAGTEAHLPAAAVLRLAAPAAAPVEGTGTFGFALPLTLALAGLAVAAIVLLVRARRGLTTDVVRAFRDAERRFRADSEDAALVVNAYAVLVGALTRRGLLDSTAASPREVERALLDAFALPPEDVRAVVDAFEAARYSATGLPRHAAQDAAAALGRLRLALGGASA